MYKILNSMEIKEAAEKAVLIKHNYKIDGSFLNYWYLINDNYSFKDNIRIGEKATGYKYRGVAADDTRYMIFS